MALFSKYKVVNKVCLIPSELIFSNPDQPRRYFDEEQIQSLAVSIRQNGLLQPVTVRQIEERRYELIAGERRLLACKEAGLKEIPCLIKEISQQQSAVLALVENLQRQDLNYFEEASAIQALLLKWNISQQEAAKRLGRSQSSIANKLRLLRLPENIREILLSSSLTERHARALLQLNHPERMNQVLGQVIEKQLNVAQTEEYIEKLNNIDRPQKKETNGRLVVVKDIKLFFNTINRAIDTMKMSGIRAQSSVREEEGFVEYTVRIPKEAYYKKSGKHTA